MATQPALETKTRLDTLRLKLTTVILTEEKLRLCRDIEVLERIGSAEARQLLKMLAGGAPGAYSTTTAQAALTRLN